MTSTKLKKVRIYCPHNHSPYVYSLSRTVRNNEFLVYSSKSNRKDQFFTVIISDTVFKITVITDIRMPTMTKLPIVSMTVAISLISTLSLISKSWNIKAEIQEEKLAMENMTHFFNSFLLANIGKATANIPKTILKILNILFHPLYRFFQILRDHCKFLISNDVFWLNP